MPVACSSSVLTGASGSVFYTPGGTKVCLLAEDLPAGAGVITVNQTNDFRVGDPVVFAVTGTATLDTGLTAGDPYVISAVDAANNTVTVTEPDGTAVTLTGNGTDGTGHVEMSYDPFGAICDIQSWSIEISREELDTTTLPCTVGAGGGKYAAFRKTQAGYASATGTLTVFFADNATSLGQRMLDNVMLRDQYGCRVRLFNNTVSDGAATPAPDLADSSYIEGDITLTGVTLDVNPDDPQQGEVTFSVQNITRLFNTDLV